MSKPGWLPSGVNSNFCTRNTTTGVLLDCMIWINYYAFYYNSTTQKNDYMAHGAFIATTMSNEVKTLTDTIPGSVIIMFERASANIIASSDIANNMLVNDGSYSLVDARLYNNTVCATAARYVDNTYGFRKIGEAKNNMTEKGSFSFFSGGNKYVANFQYVTDGEGIEWIILMTIPETAFIGKYISSIAVMAAVSFAIMVLGTLTGLIATFLLIKPLYTLVQKMSLVETMDFEALGDYGKRLSLFGEVRSIQTAFLLMVEKLKEYKAFLPSSVRTKYNLTV